MLIQIHMLQNYAPSNLNRDDSGSPKDAVFGGYRRGRISSQCLKRSIRHSETFKAKFEKDSLLGMRTKQLHDLLEQELQAMQVDAEDQKNILMRVAEIGRESSKRRKQEEGEEENSGEEKQLEEKTAQLIFIGKDELRPMAARLVELYRKYGTKKWCDPDKVKIGEITKALGKSAPKSVDIAMFGRMTTSEAFEDVQAAVQVAHALSTNALTQEFDYYTAVDDLSNETGAGMIGDVEFNSSTYYKYLSVHWEQLVHNLGNDAEVARRAVVALIQAAATAQPSGKQNSFAANNLPDVVVVEVGTRNLPVSYANAFLRPVRQSASESLMDASIGQLADYVARVTKTFGLDSNRAHISTTDCQFPNSTRIESLPLFQGWVQAQLPEA